LAAFPADGRGELLTTSGWRVGVDVGGTFTDRAALSADGRVVARKVLSTPGEQDIGVADSLRELDGQADAIVHGTTVVTNLLLERKGARVVLCTTMGAEDVLFLRRQDRAALYDLSRHHPSALVQRDDVVGVPERITPQGVERALDSAEIAVVVAEALRREPEIVVVALLHSYADARHELALAEALRTARPTLEVVTSAAVLPEIREYERFATAAAEAYSRPAVLRYLERLASRLAGDGHPAPAVMTSSGGMRPSSSAARHAASLALSGPAGGVVGASAVLRALALSDALTIDIGGTSADAGLVLNGEPLVEAGGEVAGVAIALPRVLVETVSAGGGSIAWCDDGGALRVGPRSAGARPGPVAFARGGTESTVTDAQLVLGRITARAMSGGVALDVEAPTKAVASLAAKLGSDVPRTAAAIIAIADAEMARALRRVSVERGVDPRDCVLVAFGGGGPLHACALADALDMSQIIVPPFAGVLSAVGLALASERHEAAMSVLKRCAAIGASELRELRSELESKVQGSVRRTLARVRYVGQGHELEIPLSDDINDGRAIATQFAEAHALRYGFQLPADAEIVALRHEAGESARAATFRRDARAPNFDAEKRVDAGGLAEDVALNGPTTIALPDATMFVAEGWRAEPLEIGGWKLTRTRSSSTGARA
jgi:N-methylhydantoinase A